MKLHNAIRDFIDQYDREAISSIQDLGNIPSGSAFNFLFEGVDVKKSVDLFDEYLDGYAKYRISTDSNTDHTTQTILERTEFFLENSTAVGSCPAIFEDKTLSLKDVPSICECYIESVNRLIQKIDTLTTEMKSAGTSNEEIEALCEMGDMYVSRLYPKLEKIMEYALSASGYNTKKWVDEIISKKREPKTTPVFV